jgi:type IV pilus assembly protein PilP
VRRALAIAVILVSGCGDDAAERRAPPPRPPPPPSPSAAGTAVAPLQPPIDQTKEALLAEVRKRQLSNEDFVESDNNRDPFRSYLSTFGGGPIVTHPQHKIVLEKFALDELKLVAIVGGEGVPPRAMFLDPSGKGITVSRGEHMSKADATITRIAPASVFFEIEEDMGGGKTRTVERVIELHAGEIAPPQ